MSNGQDTFSLLRLASESCPSGDECYPCYVVWDDQAKAIGHTVHSVRKTSLRFGSDDEAIVYFVVDYWNMAKRLLLHSWLHVRTWCPSLCQWGIFHIFSDFMSLLELFRLLSTCSLSLFLLLFHSYSVLDTTWLARPFYVLAALPNSFFFTLALFSSPTILFSFFSLIEFAKRKVVRLAPRRRRTSVDVVNVYASGREEGV